MMWLEGIVAAGAAFCGIMAAYNQWIVRTERRAVNERVSKWTEKQVKELSWSDALVERLDQTEWAQKLKPQLERASISLKPTEYGALLLLAFGVVIAGLHYMLSLSWLLSIGLSTFIVPIGSRLFLRSRRHGYARKLDEQLPEVCRLLSSAARAGLSVPQGLDLAAREMPAPAKDELGIVVREVQLGRNVELALKDLLKRVPTKDLQVFVNAIIIQKRSGGDLASAMSEMARTMEERKIIQKTIQASISQAKASAYALPLVSILIVLMLGKLFGGFQELFNSLPGILLLAVFVTMQIIGLLIIRKIANIRV